MPKENRPPLNIRRYLLCLLLAFCAVGVLVGIFKILPGHQAGEKEISAELVITGLPDGLTGRPLPVKFVGARVKGPAGLVKKLTDSRLTCKVNLAGVAPGVKSIALTAAHFGLPPKLRVTAINPAVISLTIKIVARKTVPVYIAVAGKPASGFTVIDTLAVPGNVTVAGPENLLVGIDRVMTRPITIAGIAESIKKETALDLPAGVSLAGMEKAIVADIRIEAETNRRTFRGIRVMKRGTDYAAVFSPPEIILEIEGPANALSKLDQVAEITAYVDLTDLKPGVYVRRATISLPLGITLIKAEPEIFTVAVSAKGS